MYYVNVPLFYLMRLIKTEVKWLFVEVKYHSVFLTLTTYS